MSMDKLFSELKKTHLEQLDEENTSKQVNEAEDTKEPEEVEVEVETKEIEEGPKLEHIYWDKKHENAYYVVAVYPKDNKVAYWNTDGTRLETTIEDFMAKYEPSTNEDDYDLFEERSENK